MTLNKENCLTRAVEAAPLAVFRIFFGLMMLLGLLRFVAYGWVDKLYIQPKFFFSYYGFEWVKPLGSFTYFIFLLCAISSIMVVLGYRYRLASILFFLSFTYIELMDKTTYLNHYYFTSLLAFLMIFLPANAYYSIDALRNSENAFQKIPVWTVNSIKLLLGIVYVYAGLSKLNSDWLIEAMPLKIWLPSKFDIPLLGNMMHLDWTPYFFSWVGALYDLTIPFFLLNKRTRPYAFAAVVIFHLLTRVLFPIGMFPYIMIVSTLIFFDASFHHKLLKRLDKWFKVGIQRFDNSRVLVDKKTRRFSFKTAILALFFLIQLCLPFRYLAYPDELFWTEEGYRFSWRVMLIEKSGYAQFKVVDTESGKWFYVDNSDFLTTFQEKQMAFQPDFILEYAHFLKQNFEKDGHKKVAVYVDSYVSLNGRLSTPYIDSKIDLTQEKESFQHKNWILPFNDEITGL
ncbi:HTTM domain-containing protein [Pseudozobellia sp. WGM2]|uniref:HTTM domain-containing protein n=1 Tax=Pseudozobellia sp. WGM2 TaxID=2787625 RepID=UPI001AE01608|nr:HTTM domain-containing protein [Pseudozobellia sp. WGM2]